LIPEVVLRSALPESKCPLSYWNSGLFFGCGERI
jgi:hypothetical protein